MSTSDHIQLDFWERFGAAFDQSNQAYHDLIDLLRKQAKDYFKKFQKCWIYGSEIEFERFVAPEDIKSVCLDIWRHPDKYSDYQADSDSAYYKFLKYLWVEFPDGTTKRLADVAMQD